MSALEAIAEKALTCKPETVEYIFNEQSLAIGSMVLEQARHEQTNFLILLAFAVVFSILNIRWFRRTGKKHIKILSGILVVAGITLAGLTAYGMLLKFGASQVWRKDVELSQQQIDTLPKPTKEQRDSCSRV